MYSENLNLWNFLLVLTNGSGCGLNVLNEPPIASLAQLEALTRGPGVSSNLTVERVTAAVLTTFERIWDLFLQEESEGFRPFMDRYTSSWLHSCVKCLLFSQSFSLACLQRPNRHPHYNEPLHLGSDSGYHA